MNCMQGVCVNNVSARRDLHLPIIVQQYNKTWGAQCDYDKPIQLGRKFISLN
jgi:hypothetical protein